MNYYISDLHLNHAKIIDYCGRPYKDVHEMNESIIKRINERVTSKDNLYILGDVGFGAVGDLVALLKRINGRKILVAGNHDKRYLKHPEFISVFKSVHEILEISDCHRKVVLFHYPMLSWNRAYHGSIHLHGHVHNSGVPYEPKNSYNVSIEMTDYRPMTLEEILRSKDRKTLRERACNFLKKMV